MATLHKFKLLATQCGVAGSPSRSPTTTTTTSPVFQIRRRKTLRMLLTRAGSARRKPHPPPEAEEEEEEDPIAKATTTPLQLLNISNKLKDLFASTSPPPPPLEDNGIRSDETSRSSTVRPGRTGSTGGSHRPLTAVFRYRLLRSRPWRPMLLSIPEYTTATTTPGD